MIRRIPSAWLVPGDEQTLNSYCMLPADPVVQKIAALDPADRGVFLWDRLLIGDALFETTDASLINFQSLGNTDRAMHAHIHRRGHRRPAVANPRPIRQDRAAVAMPRSLPRKSAMPATVDQIPGYTYAAPGLARSPVTLEELAALRITVGFTAEHESALRLAGEVLADQTAAVVNHWRSGIIAGIPNLARHSRDPYGRPLPDYLAASNLRFRQWILDTCLRPYDQHWLDYQHEIARRHTTLMKNRTDAVASTPFVPLRDVIGFVAVMNETIKPYLTTRGHPPAQVDQMHTAWCKSIQLQLALWAKTYTDPAVAGQQW